MSVNYNQIIIKGGIVKAHYLIRFNQDMGFSVNPEGSKLQMEGCVTMGLGCALSEEIRFKNGKYKKTTLGNISIQSISILEHIRIRYQLLKK